MTNESQEAIIQRLSLERIWEIAYILFQLTLAEEKFSLDGLERKIGQYSQKTKIPKIELILFAEYMLQEVVRKKVAEMKAKAAKKSTEKDSPDEFGDGDAE